MKKLGLLTIACLTASAMSAHAITIGRDTQELRLQGTLDPTTRNSSELRLNASYGYFFDDNLQAGLRVDAVDNKQVSSLGLGAFVEGNIDTGSEVMPFGEFYAGFAHVDVEESGGDDLAGVIEIRAGAKYFFADNVAISLAGVFAYATEQIYPDDRKLRDTDIFMELALRTYF